jgi:hypothetical protein
MSRLREENQVTMSRLREENQVTMSRLREENQVTMSRLREENQAMSRNYGSGGVTRPAARCRISLSR